MSEQPTVSEEQLVLFKEHLDLQREELAERRESNRAEESIELKRISVEQAIHDKNLKHAEFVVNAQLQDREGIRQFWSVQCRWIFFFVYGLMFTIGLICCIAIYKGDSENVFKMLTAVLTYGLTFVAGIGADRIWTNRKKQEIVNNSQQG